LIQIYRARILYVLEARMPTTLPAPAARKDKRNTRRKTAQIDSRSECQRHVYQTIPATIPPAANRAPIAHPHASPKLRRPPLCGLRRPSRCARNSLRPRTFRLPLNAPATARLMDISSSKQGESTPLRWCCDFPFQAPSIPARETPDKCGLLLQVSALSRRSDLHRGGRGTQEEEIDHWKSVEEIKRKQKPR
jgi:hypothetical protein